MKQSLKILLMFVISGILFQAFEEAHAVEEIPHKPAAQETTEDVKGSITPATLEQQQQLEEEINKAKQKGEVKKPKKKKKNKKESKKPTT
jgi:hypothetical protein